MNRSVLTLTLIAGVAITTVSCCSSKKPAAQASASAVPALTPSVDEWGYAERPNPPLEGTPTFRVISVSFDEGSVDLTPEATAACKEAATRLRELPHARVAAIGFADGVREKERAEELGLRRAESARDCLSALGIPPEWIEVASYGDRCSTAKVDEEREMDLDRKVEIWVLE